jgi:hypothetical protein
MQKYCQLLVLSDLNNGSVSCILLVANRDFESVNFQGHYLKTAYVKIKCSSKIFFWKYEYVTNIFQNVLLVFLSEMPDATGYCAYYLVSYFM